MSMNDKLKAFRDSQTPEQKREQILKMQEARLLKRENIEANKHNVKRDYLDSNYWAELATRYKIRMPSNDEATSAKVVRKYLKRAGIEVAQFNEHYTSIAYFVKHNSKWSSYATAGIILELKQDVVAV